MVVIPVYEVRGGMLPLENVEGYSEFDVVILPLQFCLNTKFE